MSSSVARALAGSRSRSCSAELHPYGQRDQVLLRAVVQVPLDRAPCLVGRRHDAPAGGLDLRSLTPHLVQARLQRRVQLRVVQHGAELPRDLDDRAFLFLA